jgi:hypothetical protein
MAAFQDFRYLRPGRGRHRDQNLVNGLLRDCLGEILARAQHTYALDGYAAVVDVVI